MSLRVFGIVAVVAATGAQAQLVTKLSPATNQAFEQYVSASVPAALEQAKADRPMPWLGDAALARARKGELVVKGMTGDNGKSVPDGLIHDWIAGVFIPDTTLAKVTSVVQDFARHKQWYPEIIDSALIARTNGNARGTWLLRKKKVITVVLRAELDSRLHPTGSRHAYLISETKPIVEVRDHGTPRQSDYPAGEGHGFLWRFNGYWNFHESDGGVYVECRVISLSRDVPTGFGWIVNPFIRSMPRESLESTMTNTRKAVRSL